MLRANTPPEPRDRSVLLDDADRARTMFEQLYHLPKVDLHHGPERRFAWQWQISPRGTATIIRGRSRAGAVAIAGGLTHFVLILAPQGSLELCAGGRRFDILPDRTAGIASAGMEAAARSRHGMRTLNIRIEPGALISHATALLGAPASGPLRFETHIDLRTEAGAGIVRLAHLLEEACAHPQSPLGSPHVLAHLREALYGALLVGQPSSLHHLLRKPAPVAHARAVRQAEEILAARAAEPLSIAEVAALTGVGLRSLERSFKAARGCSLRDFLKEQRLDLAHRRLRAAAPGTTVTQILQASGFSHPGEFSLAYRKRFGEAPSQTLRRAAGEGSPQFR